MWFTETIVETGRLPLFCFLCSFLVAFLFIRFSVRMIRAQVKWWPGNVTPGGMHIHHMVFGLVMLLISGFVLIAVASYDTPVPNILLASVFGIGAALVLDEWALLLHLSDVYWTQEGRSSIDAVFVAFTITSFFLLGIHPLGFQDDFDGLSQADLADAVLIIGFFVLQLALAVITLAKGKVWSGLVGLFIAPLLIVTAIRLGRPHSPWARWRYATRPRRMDKAVYREKTYRRPVIRVKIAVQEAIAGHFDPDIVNAATEAAQAAHEAATDRAAAAARDAATHHP